MFAEVIQFVRKARELPGIERIALIGSLATGKESPKDIDLLVTVTDDCDLAPLAKLARQLNGHMLQHSAGAEVFLANPAGDYIGRTCPWKDCGPGYRTTCDALHCGQRLYLHDDLNTVRLPRSLIAEPPVILWPQPSANPDVPQDVKENLIDPIVQDTG
jgi:predicted nucleotidyltransferase